MADLVQWSAAPGTNPRDGYDINLGARLEAHTGNANNNTGPSGNNSHVKHVNLPLDNEENGDSNGNGGNNNNGADDGNGEDDDNDADVDAEEDYDDNNDDNIGASQGGRGGSRGGRGRRGGRGGRGGTTDQLPMAQGRAVTGWSLPISVDVNDDMDVDQDVVVAPGDLCVVRGQSRAIYTGDDPRSEALALEANWLIQDEETSLKCSSCLDFGALKKCLCPGSGRRRILVSSMLDPPLQNSVTCAYLTGCNHARHPLIFHTIALKLNTYPEFLLRLQLEEQFSPYRHLLQCSNIELFTRVLRTMLEGQIRKEGLGLSLYTVPLT
ncbi:hypothetical protein EDD22DRAFT_849088 [Suillus occidentalis]|nr:hypothetical protein EDD22DRAFT_849088 [Suillus occidentalis]